MSDSEQVWLTFKAYTHFSSLYINSFPHNNDTHMKESSLEITPETNIGNLLKTYPQLEDELIKMAPPFKNSKTLS